VGRNEARGEGHFQIRKRNVEPGPPEQRDGRGKEKEAVRKVSRRLGNFHQKKNEENTVDLKRKRKKSKLNAQLLKQKKRGKKSMVKRKFFRETTEFCPGSSLCPGKRGRRK